MRLAAAQCIRVVVEQHPQQGWASQATAAVFLVVALVMLVFGVRLLLSSRRRKVPAEQRFKL